jgi:transposase InsO family protein
LPLLGGYSVILVVVDHFTKYAHIYPLKHPYTASSVGATFLNNVVKLHGLPKSIVSDRDKIFTSNFWTKLFELLNIKLQMSLAYHPQTDGQTERMNQCLEMYLWCVISSTPKQWVKWLPLAEVWYNSSYHSSSKCSPFKALYGSEPSVEAIPEPVLTDNTDLNTTLAERHHFSELLKDHLAGHKIG